MPDETADLIGKMLAVEPEDRYESMKQLAREIAKLPRETRAQQARIDYSKVLGKACH